MSVVEAIIIALVLISIGTNVAVLLMVRRPRRAKPAAKSGPDHGDAMDAMLAALPGFVEEANALGRRR